MILTCTLQKQNWSKQIYLYANKVERKILHLKIEKFVSQRKKRHKSSMIQLIFEKNNESLVCFGLFF